MLHLGDNDIVSVAVEAFKNLVALQVDPDKFNPVDANGDAYYDFFGNRVWHHAEPGFFGGGQEWAQTAMSFAPNPVECRWVGPRVSDLECDSCLLGFQVTYATPPLPLPLVTPPCRW